MFLDKKLCVESLWISSHFGVEGYEDSRFSFLG